MPRRISPQRGLYAQHTTAYEELIQLHTRRYRSKGDSGSFQSQRYRQFHLALMKQALQAGELRLMTLNFNGTIIAVEYAFMSKSVLALFQTGFDPDYSHLSPGHMLMMQTIDQAINDGARKIDLLKGDYPYKRTYTKTTSLDMDIWKSPIVYGISRLARFLRTQRLRST